MVGWFCTIACQTGKGTYNHTNSFKENIQFSIIYFFDLAKNISYILQQRVSLSRTHTLRVLLLVVQFNAGCYSVDSAAHTIAEAGRLVIVLTAFLPDSVRAVEQLTKLKLSRMKNL